MGRWGGASTASSGFKESRVASVGPELGYVFKMGQTGYLQPARILGNSWAQNRLEGYALFTRRSTCRSEINARTDPSRARRAGVALRPPSRIANHTDCAIAARECIRNHRAAVAPSCSRSAPRPRVQAGTLIHHSSGRDFAPVRTRWWAVFARGARPALQEPITFVEANLDFARSNNPRKSVFIQYPRAIQRRAPGCR